MPQLVHVADVILGVARHVHQVWLWHQELLSPLALLLHDVEVLSHGPELVGC